VPVDLEVDAGIAVITLNRPEKLNAMDAEAYAQLSDAWTRVRDDDAIRVAVITGAGDRSFTTGADLSTFVGQQKNLTTFWQTQRGQLLNRGLEMWKPVIAAVNGYCIGGGMTLLLATDIRFAVPTATFGVAEVRRGVVAGNGGTQRILEQLPYAVAMEVLLTGRTVTAEEAERWGLVNRIVPPEQLMETALETAHTIAANAPLAVQAAKELALRSRDVDRATGLRLEQAMNQVLQFTDDATEGPAAFREKRPAQFTGR
jgi:E-phenylitaconyl-CoA hydratase